MEARLRWSHCSCYALLPAPHGLKCPSGVTAAPGDLDLNPDMGQYRLSANVAHVEANDLRRTLGVRPPPLPIGGALRGIMHCTGPLEQPVFSGAAAAEPTSLPDCERYLKCVSTEVSAEAWHTTAHALQSWLAGRVP